MHGGRWGAAAAGLLLLLGTGCGPETQDGDAREFLDEEVAEAPSGQQAFALQAGRTNSARASADARVDASAPDTNYGATTRLRVDGMPEAESYLRFDLVGLGAKVNNAKLRLYATSAGDDPVVWPVSNDWSESTITWNLRPGHPDRPLIGALPVEDESWVEFDVTQAVQGDGTFSFAVGMYNSDGASFVSRNSDLEALRPVLVVNTEPADCTPGSVVESHEVILPDRAFYVSAGSPDSRLSRKTTMWVDADVARESFLSFMVDLRSRELRRAELVLHSASDGTAQGPSLYRVAPGTWGPSSRTWNTRPQTEGAPLATMGAVPPYTTTRLDVTDLVRSGSGSLGSNNTGYRLELALKSDSSDGLELFSPYTINDAVAPRLVLTFDRPCPE